MAPLAVARGPGAWHLSPMLTLLKLIQSIIKTLHSEGTPGQVALGSVVGWLALTVPIFFAARYGVARYRATIGERVRQSRFYKAVTASQVYNWYRLFRPG